MASRIQEITVEIGGDTTKLQNSLKGVNGQIKSTQAQLKDVNKLLKLDPSNAELLAQKHKLLAEAVGETKEKLATLKTAAEQANTALANGEISQEQYDALQREIVETEQDFRKYACVEQSIADHSAYLLGAMNGKKKRYEGLAGEKDYLKAVQIIKNGGYATDSLYVQKICVIIEKYGLTRFDCVKTKKEVWYRVRKSWQDAESQVGAFKVLDNAKKCADEHPGFSVFEEDGKAVYSSVDKKPEEVFRPYLVRVEIPDLNIRVYDTLKLPEKSVKNP